jgi:hypothetical protein
VLGGAAEHAIAEVDGHAIAFTQLGLDNDVTLRVRSKQGT